MNTKHLWMTALGLAVGGLVVGCDVDVEDPGDVDMPEFQQTDEGNLDMPDVDVEGGDLDMPNFEQTEEGNVDLPDVDVDVPDVDVDMDVDPAVEGDADEVNEPAGAATDQPADGDTQAGENMTTPAN